MNDTPHDRPQPLAALASRGSTSAKNGDASPPPPARFPVTPEELKAHGKKLRARIEMLEEEAARLRARGKSGPPFRRREKP